MSFSSETKEELSKINNLVNKEAVKYEFIGYLLSINTIINNKSVKYSTSSEYNINRFSKLLNNINILDYKIDLQGKIYFITLSKGKLKKIVEINSNEIIINQIITTNEENIRALVRGIFLGSGSINNPENKYHLEMNLSNIEYANYIKKLLEKYAIHLKMLEKEKSYSLYIKEGEEISKFLAFIGANKSVLKFEGIRVQREMNNKVNRIVNCETANLNKTINASINQVEAIRYLQKINKFEKLDDNLKEIALLRLKNPNIPLSELGKLLKEPIGKSGVNYRLKRIMQIAEDSKGENI
mgnify:FL=1